jgi:hypothetical protein
MDVIGIFWLLWRIALALCLFLFSIGLLVTIWVGLRRTPGIAQNAYLRSCSALGRMIGRARRAF